MRFLREARRPAEEEVANVVPSGQTAGVPGRLASAAERLIKWNTINSLPGPFFSDRASPQG